MAIDIEELATKPQSVTVDNQSVSMPPLKDLIEADKYLKSNDAVEHVHRGLRFAKISFPAGG